MPSPGSSFIVWLWLIDRYTLLTPGWGNYSAIVFAPKKTFDWYKNKTLSERFRINLLVSSVLVSDPGLSLEDVVLLGASLSEQLLELFTLLLLSLSTSSSSSTVRCRARLRQKIKSKFHEWIVYSNNPQIGLYRLELRTSSTVLIIERLWTDR